MVLLRVGWAATTVTTVGYGDRFPITPVGRTIAAGAMIIGIGLFGLLAASLASFLVEKDLEKGIDPQITEMHERLERMERLLENLQPNGGYTRYPRDRHDRFCWGRLKRRLLIWTWEPRPTCAAIASAIGPAMHPDRPRATTGAQLG